jgi:T5SS/PEP-CTERM-associated repeat protein
MCSIRVKLAGVVGVLILASASTAYATEYNWNNPDGGTLSDVNNWDVPVQGSPVPIHWSEPNYWEAATILPDYQAQLFFQLRDPFYDPDTPETVVNYTVELDEGTFFEAADFIVNSGDVTLQLNGGQLALGDYSGYSNSYDILYLQDGGNLVVGAYNDYQPSRLTLADGQVTANSTLVGASFFADGTLNVADYTQLNTNDLIVGNEEESIGTVNLLGWESGLVTEQTTVGRLYDSTGTVNLQRGLWETDQLTIGFAGDGTVNVVEGQLNAIEVRLGEMQDGVGHINISAGPEGSGSLETGYLLLGVEGEGHLSVSNGGEVYAGWTQVGYQAGYATASSGSITVSGPGSHFTTDRLSLGVEGSGTLNVTDGGRVDTYETYVGGSADMGGAGTGQATIEGYESTLATGYLTVGGSGDGTLVIRDRGLVQSGYAAVGEMANGSILVTGESSLDLHQLSVGSSGGNGTVTVEAGSSAGISELMLGNASDGTGSFTVSGASIAFVNTATVGYGGTGMLAVRDGAFMTIDDLFLGGQDQGGIGTLEISDQARMEVRNVQIGSQEERGTSGITVAGVGTEFFAEMVDLGVDGSGSMLIEQGGYASHAMLNIGSAYSQTGSGQVIVDGPGSRLDSDEIYLANGGSGDLQISNGGQVAAGMIWMGAEDAEGMLSVDGAGSELEVHQLVVGEYSGTNIISVSNGGLLRNFRDIELGAGYMGTGTSDMVVTDSGSQVITEQLIIGQHNSGSVTVSDNAELVADGIAVGGDFDGTGSSGSLRVASGALVIARQYSQGGSAGGDPDAALVVSKQGSVDIDGGTLYSHNDARIKDGGQVTVNSGVLDVSQTIFIENGGSLMVNSGGYVSASFSVEIGNGAQAIINGTLNAGYGGPGGGGPVTLSGELSGSGTIEGDLYNSNGGVLNPGNSPGRLYIDGNYEQDALSSLIIELAGDEAGINFDVLDIEGDANLDGELIVKLLDKFIPQIGDSFEILTAGNFILSEFSQLVLPQLGEGMEWQLSYNDDGLSGEYAAAAAWDEFSPYNVTLRVQASVVPIPGAVWLLGSGLGLLGWFRRK